MTVGLNDICTFGKFKKKPYHEIIAVDPEYLLWLRAAKIKAGETNGGFDHEIHSLLDTYLEANKKLLRKYSYYTGALAAPSLAPVTAEAPLEPEVAPEGWGNW